MRATSVASSSQKEELRYGDSVQPLKGHTSGLGRTQESPSPVSLGAREHQGMNLAWGHLDRLDPWEG